MDSTTNGPPRAGWVYRLAAWAGIGVMRLQRWRFNISGQEHVPAEGGALIAANHQSFWDFFAVSRYPYEALGRPVRILAKKSMFEVPLFGRFMYATGCIPVDRSRGVEAFRGAIEALQRGELVLIMPEGTISRSFDLLPFRSGAARMAQTAGVPLIPAASWGSHRFHTSLRRARFRWKLPVSVRYGSPFTPIGDAAETSELLKEAVQAQLDRAIDSYADGSPTGAWWVPARLGGGAPDHILVEQEWEDTRASWKSQGH